MSDEINEGKGWLWDEAESELQFIMEVELFGRKAGMIYRLGGIPNRPPNEQIEQSVHLMSERGAEVPGFGLMPCVPMTREEYAAAGYSDDEREDTDGPVAETEDGLVKAFAPLTISLPLPPQELSPNARPHFMRKAKVTKGYRTAAKLAALEAMGGGDRPRHGKAATQVVWYRKTLRQIDGDNALSSLKAAWDGITESGYLADDRGLIHHPVRFELDRARPRVELTITPEVCA